MKLNLRTTISLACLLATAGCAVPVANEEPIDWSADWFRCDSRFECIAVLDSYCKYTAVNSRYSLVYQDWSRQQVERVGELVPCENNRGDEQPLAAVCRNHTCEHPASR